MVSRLIRLFNSYRQERVNMYLLLLHPGDLLPHLGVYQRVVGMIRDELHGRTTVIYLFISHSNFAVCTYLVTSLFSLVFGINSMRITREFTKT